MALISIEGQITAIQHPSRTLVIKDKEWISHPVRWPQGMDERMSKQQQWWFCKVTGEESDGVIMLQDLGFFKKPADWPQGNHAKGNYTGPRSDPIQIARQSMAKCAVEIVAMCNTKEGGDPREVTKEVIEIARELVKFVQEG